MKVQLENVKPKEIETRSFEIITEELGEKKLTPETELIVKRCIHTSADFDYAENLCFSENAVEKALEAIKNGACIVTDTQMAKAGINKKALQNMAEKYIVLCRMKMWQNRQKNREAPEPLPVWIKQLLWKTVDFRHWKRTYSIGSAI